MSEKQYLSQVYPLTSKQRELMLVIGQSNFYLYWGELSKQQKKSVLVLVQKGLLSVDTLGLGILRFTQTGYKRWVTMKK